MDDFSFDTSDIPEMTETPEILETPEVPEIPEIPEVPDIPDGDDPTIHTRPGGIETLPNVESEPIETPRIPEKPYGGNPEGGW